MMYRGVSTPDAARTIVTVLAEMLVDGFGPHGAAQHLRRMAHTLDTEKTN